MSDTKDRAEVIVLPEGRVLVQCLFERDTYKDPETGVEGKPRYKIVLAFNPSDVTGEGTVEAKMADAIEAAYGKPVGDEWYDHATAGTRADRISPLKDGTKIADEGATAGKDRENSRGLLVLTATTTFNKDGEVGPGGIRVYGPDNKLLTAMDQGQLYNGCYGRAAITLKAYKDYPRKGDRALTCYLSAFQKTRDGDRIGGGGAEAVSPFQPVAGAASSAAGGRSRSR